MGRSARALVVVLAVLFAAHLVGHTAHREQAAPTRSMMSAGAPRAAHSVTPLHRVAGLPAADVVVAVLLVAAALRASERPRSSIPHLFRLPSRAPPLPSSCA